MNQNKTIQVLKPLIREQSINAVSEVLRSGWLGLGPKTEEFENNIIKYLGSSNFASYLNSATSALHLALHILDLQDGDEVITTGLTFCSTNNVILQQRAKLVPVFTDIDRTTGCLDPEDIERKITSRTTVIIVVLYAGYSADMVKINTLAEKHNIKVIEDAAHAMGGSYENGLKIGNSNNIVCLSFQAVKNLPVGDGGMILVPTKEMLERCNKLRWLGIDKSTHSRTSKVGEYLWKYEVDELGYKFHGFDITAAIGVEQLKFLDGDNARREHISNLYRQELNGVPGILPFVDRSKGKSSCHFEPILVDRRDDLIQHLKAHGIHPGVHYRNNANYSAYSQYKTDLPNTDWFENHEITLPIHMHLSNEDLDYIINTVKKGW